MTTFGITPQGFTPRRTADIIASLQTKMSQVTDPATGQTLDIDLTNGDDSLIAQFAGIIAEQLADIENLAALAYNQFDPLYNSGEGQSATVQLNGIIRNPATAAVLTLSLGGTAGAYVPAGSIVQTLDGLFQFATNTTVQLPATGVAATCTTSGVMASSTADLQIYTPVTGWATVTETAIAQGTAAETDAELRARQQVATSTTSYRQIDALYAGVMAVPGVTFCRIFSNSTVADAVPSQPINYAASPINSTVTVAAKSVAAVVVGGTNLAVAEALFLKTPIGVGYVVTNHGMTATSVNLTDVQGFVYPIKFVRPAAVAIAVAVTITNIGPGYPGDTTAQADVAAAIAAFAAANYVPGVSVYASSLYGPALAAAGVNWTVSSITVNAGASVPVDWWQQAALTITVSG